MAFPGNQHAARQALLGLEGALLFRTKTELDAYAAGELLRGAQLVTAFVFGLQDYGDVPRPLIYVFNPDDEAAADGSKVLLPNGLTAQDKGRWRRFA